MSKESRHGLQLIAASATKKKRFTAAWLLRTSEAWASALRLSSAVPSLVATSSVITAGRSDGPATHGRTSGMDANGSSRLPLVHLAKGC